MLRLFGSPTVRARAGEVINPERRLPMTKGIDVIGCDKPVFGLDPLDAVLIDEYALPLIKVYDRERNMRERRIKREIAEKMNRCYREQITWGLEP
jgi:hypothetical protein